MSSVRIETLTKLYNHICYEWSESKQEFIVCDTERIIELAKNHHNCVGEIDEWGALNIYGPYIDYECIEMGAPIQKAVSVVSVARVEFVIDENADIRAPYLSFTRRPN